MVPPHQRGRPHVSPTLSSQPPQYTLTHTTYNRQKTLLPVLRAICFGHRFGIPLRVDITNTLGIVSFHYSFFPIHPTEPPTIKSPFENDYSIFPPEHPDFANHKSADDTLLKQPQVPTPLTNIIDDTRQEVIADDEIDTYHEKKDVLNHDDISADNDITKDVDVDRDKYSFPIDKSKHNDKRNISALKVETLSISDPTVKSNDETSHEKSESLCVDCHDRRNEVQDVCDTCPLPSPTGAAELLPDDAPTMKDTTTQTPHVSTIVNSTQTDLSLADIDKLRHSVHSLQSQLATSQEKNSQQVKINNHLRQTLLKIRTFTDLEHSSITTNRLLEFEIFFKKQIRKSSINFVEFSKILFRDFTSDFLKIAPLPPLKFTRSPFPDNSIEKETM